MSEPIIYTPEMIFDPRMRALSIRQPWPHRIFHEGKDVENRDWSTSYRGPFLIHAGKSEAEDRELIREQKLPLGGIVGLARLTRCVREMDSRWFFGPYGFVLSNALPLPLIECKGALGFFKPERSVLEAVATALAAKIAEAAAA